MKVIQNVATLLSVAAAVAVTHQALGREVHLRASVSESQVVRPDAFQPPKLGTGSPGIGKADLRVDTESGDFTFDLTVDGVDAAILENTIGPNLTAIHIHQGDADVRGPVIIDCHHIARGLLPETNGVTVTETGFQLHAEGTIEAVQGQLDTGFTKPEIIEFLITEEAFVAAHTSTNDLFKTGAIRGNFKVVPEEIRLEATVDESQVVRPEAFQPPKFGTGSPGVGKATLSVNTRTGAFIFDVEIDGIDPAILDNTVGANLTALHVHNGTPDVRGPVIIDVHHFAREALPETNGVTITEAGFRMHSDGLIAQVQGALDTGFTRDEIIDFLLTEEAFVAVHTTTNDLFKTGAIRGHFALLPDEVRLSALLNESQVVRPEAFQPPKFGTGSPGIGVANLSANRVNGRFSFDMEVQGIDPAIVDNTVGANLTGIHVHRGTPDVRGPVIIDVHHFARQLAPATNGFTVTQGGFRLHAEGRIRQVQGDLDTGFTTDEIIAGLVTDQSFVALHTTTNDLFKTGAIRGSLKEVSSALPPFIRGDCDGDGEPSGNVNDAIVLLGYLFLGAVEPRCLTACDANGDGEVSGQVTDPVYMLSHSFLGGPPPPPPYPTCGTVELPTDAAIGCEESGAGCEGA